MEIFKNLILIFIPLALFLRASSLAEGKKIKKLFTGENFLIWQKVLALYLVAIIVYFVLINNYLYWFMIIALIIDGFFYLQPTPRTTKKLLFCYIILSVIAAMYSVFS